jgi:hypothetical protein
MRERIPFRERIYCSVEEGMDAIGVGRTKFYELINAGVVRIRKVGKKTLVEVDSLKLTEAA